MMFGILIKLLLGGTIGFSLGLLGGGGSILTVPALVYVVGQSPQAAISASLVIVGLNAGIGVFFRRAAGLVNWRVALIFGGVGMVAAYFAAGLSSLLSDAALLSLFALLMLTIGGLMLRRGGTDAPATPREWPMMVATGLIVGVLTGFLGVGGGFLIVPALVMVVGLPMRQAIGTSLVIIAMNSFAGLLGHLGTTHIDGVTIALFVGAGALGTLLGTRVAGRLSPTLLRRAFAVFIIVLAVGLLWDNVTQIL